MLQEELLTTTTVWPGFEPRGYFHIYVDSGHFWGVQNLIFNKKNLSFFYLFILFFFIFFFLGGGGVRKNEYFRGYDEIVDIFGGSSQS